MSATIRRRLVAGLVLAAAGAAAAPAAASAASLVAARCPTYVPGVVGPYVGVAGSGFTPGGFVNFSYGHGLDGALDANAAGQFAGRIPGPSSITRGRHVRGYALTATDLTNPFIVARTLLKVVRFDAVVRAKHPKPRQRITWHIYGFPRHRRIYAHYVFHHKVRRNYPFGRAHGACGLRKIRVRTLPTRVHVGTWHIYLTNHRRFHHKQTLVSYTYRHIVIGGPRAAAAAAATGAENRLRR